MTLSTSKYILATSTISNRQTTDKKKSISTEFTNIILDTENKSPGKQSKLTKQKQ